LYYPAICPIIRNDLNAMVNATLTALAVPVVPAASTAIPTYTLSSTPMSNFPTGVIRGVLSYPSEMIPAERVVAWNTLDGSYYSVDTIADQFDYELEVLTGTYYVVAYTIRGNGFPGGFAGGYSQMVLCGLAAACTDHALIPVSVTAGAALENINPADWYAPMDAFPPAPQ
jgi:hypothetical protein